jgi:ectoine hydroxylase-related dioxygenase (phytanoyl-CoA dioxygenase family)
MKEIEFPKETLPWIDTQQAPNIINQLLDNAVIDIDTAKNLIEYENKGYVIFENLIDHKLCDQLLLDYERLWLERPACLVRHNNSDVKMISSLATRSEVGINFRINDFHNLSMAAANIAMQPKIIKFMQLVFNQVPVAMQSLFFEYGSQQSAHQDFVFVPSGILSHLSAIWVALEDIGPNQGPLSYYPYSHKIRKFDFGDNELTYKATHSKEWDQHIESEIKRLNLKEEHFIAKKGDVLIWHGSLLHGGSAIKDYSLTRKSFIVHYSDIEAFPSDYRDRSKKPTAIYKNGGCYYQWDHPEHVEGRFRSY